MLPTRESIIQELREAKGMALAQGDRKAIKLASKALAELGAHEFTEQEAAEIDLIVQDDCVKTALYRHYDKYGALLYIGVSLHAVQRLIDHRDKSHWYEDITRIEVQWYLSRSEAYAAEKHAIKTEKPKHNIVYNGNASPCPSS